MEVESKKNGVFLKGTANSNVGWILPMSDEVTTKNPLLDLGTHSTH